MRVSRYIVTAMDYVGIEGRDRRLVVQPSESLPEERRAKIRDGELQELLKVLNRLTQEGDTK